MNNVAKKNPFAKALWPRTDESLSGALLNLSNLHGKTLEKRVITRHFCSDGQANFNIPAVLQNGFRNCGRGIHLNSLTLRQNGSSWDIVRDYLSFDEEVVMSLNKWKDLEDLDCSVLQELVDGLSQVKADWRAKLEAMVPETELPSKTLVDKMNRTADADFVSWDDEDDDSFWG
jgi:hypothetical protein